MKKMKNIKQSNVQVGDKVLLKHALKKRKSEPIYQEEPFEVIAKKGSQVVARRGEEVKVRNSSLMKRIHTREKPLEVLPEDDHIAADSVPMPDIPEPAVPERALPEPAVPERVLPELAVQNRPQRITTVPTRYDQYVMYQ